MLKVVGTSPNHVDENSVNPTANKDEKRSKKERKNKKEKKEEIKKETKNSIFIEGNKQTCVENSIGGLNNKLKGKPNGVHPEVKGFSSEAELLFKPVGNNINCQVADNFPEPKNASKSLLATICTICCVL